MTAVAKPGDPKSEPILPWLNKPPQTSTKLGILVDSPK